MLARARAQTPSDQQLNYDAARRTTLNFELSLQICHPAGCGGNVHCLLLLHNYNLHHSRIRCVLLTDGVVVHGACLKREAPRIDSSAGFAMVRLNPSVKKPLRCRQERAKP